MNLKTRNGRLGLAARTALRLLAEGSVLVESVPRGKYGRTTYRLVRQGQDTGERMHRMTRDHFIRNGLIQEEAPNGRRRWRITPKGREVHEAGGVLPGAVPHRSQENREDEPP